MIYQPELHTDQERLNLMLYGSVYDTDAIVHISFDGKTLVINRRVAI